MMSFLRTHVHFFLHDMKLKYKFIIINLLLVLVPTFVVLLFVYGRLSHIIRHNTIESEQALVSQTANTIDATVSQLDLAMDNITSMPFLSAVTLSDNPVHYLARPENYEKASEFFSSINSLIDRELITSIKIYLPQEIDAQNQYTFSNIILSESQIQGSYWHGIFAGSPNTISLYCPSFYLTSRELSKEGSSAYIKRFYNVANPAAGTIYIAIYFDESQLADSLVQNLTSINSVYYLINSRNSVVTSSNPVLAGTYFMSYEDIPSAIGNIETFSTVKILDENLYMGYRNIRKTDWRLVSVIPESSIFTEGQQLILNTIYLYILFVLIACITAVLLSGSIAGRISRVVDEMNRYKGQTPVKLVDYEDRDEIGQLTFHYNDMVSRVHELMEEQTETAEKLKVSEVNALQAQINPHFLYNMLDMINWLSQSGKQREVSIAVQTLSKFYKLTLSKKNITTPIREELSHVELYVKLQNMRYEDKIAFLIDVPDEILDYQIPKLVLQPIVENSIQHGIFEKENKEGQIVIMAWMEDNDIVFTISDDGVGIPADVLPTILDGNGTAGSGSNIAIYNTHLRLQLLYGEAYGLHYDSVYGQGTEVQVRLPAVDYLDK